MNKYFVRIDVFDIAEPFDVALDDNQLKLLEYCFENDIIVDAKYTIIDKTHFLDLTE